MKHKKRGSPFDSVRLAIPLFFMTILLNVPFPARSQDSLPPIKVSVNGRNQSINQFLDEITLQSGYNFTYNADLIPGKKKVSLKVSNLSIRETLDSLLGNPGFSYRVIDRNIVIYKENISEPVPLSDEIDNAGHCPAVFNVISTRQKYDFIHYAFGNADHWITAVGVDDRYVIDHVLHLGCPASAHVECRIEIRHRRLKGDVLDRVIYRYGSEFCFPYYVCCTGHVFTHVGRLAENSNRCDFNG